jgi:hypothetical protein
MIPHQQHWNPKVGEFGWVLKQIPMDQTRLRKFECWEPQDGVRKEEKQGEFWLLRERFKRDGTGADFLMGCGMCMCNLCGGVSASGGWDQLLGESELSSTCMCEIKQKFHGVLSTAPDAHKPCLLAWGGGLRIFLYLVAVAEEEKNEIPEPDFGEDKGWCVSRPLFLHLCLLKRLTQCCW